MKFIKKLVFLKLIGRGFVNFWHKITILFKRINFSKVKDSKFYAFVTSRIFTQIIIWLFVLISITQAVFAVLIYGFKSESKPVRIVARIVPYPFVIVNQDVITYNDYLKEKDYIHHFYQATQQDNIDFSSIDKEILNQLIENKLIRFQAFRNHVSVNDKDIDSTVNQIVDQNGGTANVDKVLNELYGLNLAEFKDLVRVQMIREKLNNDVIQKVKVRHILVRVEKDAPADKVNEAKAKIDGYLNEIKGGLDFGEAAKKYSGDTGSADAGGLLQPFAEGEMVPEFSKVAFSTPVGTISDPVRTDFGWHIIKVEEKTGKIQKSFADWLDGMKKRSLIIKL